MKKIILNSLVVLLSFSGTIAYAQTTQTQTVKDIRDDAKAKIQETRTDMANKIIGNRFDKMNKRFEATIQRLTAIKAKIQTRIDKIKAAGGQTLAAEKLLADAQKSLDSATAKLATLKSAGDMVVTNENASSTPTVKAKLKTAMTNLRTAAKNLEKDLQSARDSLSKAIGSLKGLSQLKTATSTGQTTNQ